MDTEHEKTVIEIPMTVPVDDLADDLETIRLAKAEQRKWRDVQDAATEKVKERLGEAEVGTVGGRTAVKMSHRDVTRVNVAKLRADMSDELLAARGYLRTTVERRFELTD